MRAATREMPARCGLRRLSQAEGLIEAMRVLLQRLQVILQQMEIYMAHTGEQP